MRPGVAGAFGAMEKLPATVFLPPLERGSAHASLVKRMNVVPLVSIVIPARNQAGRLPAFFDALRLQTAASETYEVIVVDDFSTDGTAAIAEANGARVVRLPRHGGPYVARNQGIGIAKAPFLAFTDADCTPRADWIENGLRSFERREVEMVAGRFDVPLGDPPTVAELLHFARFLDQERNVKEHQLSGGGNLWIRRETFDRIGLFNEQLLSGGDKEFCQRAVAAGTRLDYEPDVVTAHPSCRSHWVAARRSFRIGFGVAQHRFYAEGPAAKHPRVWSRPGAYVPRTRIYGFERLERHGYRPNRLQRIMLPVVEYIGIRLPIVAGNLAGSIREFRRARTAR